MTRFEKCQILKEKGFRYDSDTGKIYGVKGKEITSKAKGYIIIGGGTHFKSNLLAHHYAWYYTYGNVDYQQLDHINRIRTDNRIDNLRVVSHQENMWNNGGKGYYWNKQANKWQSYIYLNGKQIHLGLFNTEDEARNIYLQAKQKYHIIKDIYI
jgi:hypothetical protein